MNKDQYQKILADVLSCSKTPITPGNTIIALWKNEAQLEQWTKLAADSSEIRILTVPTASVPMLKIEGNIKAVTVVAVGFGVKEDYSDVRVVYHMTIAPKK